MAKITYEWLYQVKDNTANPNTKYGGIAETIVFNKTLEQKYVDTETPYRHAYYFTSEWEGQAFARRLRELYAKANKESSASPSTPKTFKEKVNYLVSNIWRWIKESYIPDFAQIPENVLRFSLETALVVSWGDALSLYEAYVQEDDIMEDEQYFDIDEYLAFFHHDHTLFDCVNIFTEFNHIERYDPFGFSEGLQGQIEALDAAIQEIKRNEHK